MYMKVFISMGMKSKSTEQVRVEMEKVFSYIEDKLPEAELVDSIINGAGTAIARRGDDLAMWYLAKSIEKMSEADIVFFVNNWQDFRGCVAERKVAESYNKFCVDIEFNIDK